MPNLSNIQVQNAQSNLQCTISLEPLIQAVITNEGLSYDRNSILHWLRNPNSNGRDPLTQNLITTLKQNFALQHAQEEWTAFTHDRLDQYYSTVINDYLLLLQPTTPSLSSKVTQNDCWPFAFICPITRHIIKDPVITPYGNTFERSALVAHLQMNHKDPLTGRELHTQQLITNRNLKSLLDILNASKPRFQINNELQRKLTIIKTLLIPIFNANSPSEFKSEEQNLSILLPTNDDLLFEDRFFQQQRTEKYVVGATIIIVAYAMFHGFMYGFSKSAVEIIHHDYGSHSHCTPNLEIQGITDCEFKFKRGMEPLEPIPNEVHMLLESIDESVFYQISTKINASNENIIAKINNTLFDIAKNRIIINGNLGYAAWNGDEQSTRQLIRENREDINKKNVFGITPLIAVIFGQLLLNNNPYNDSHYLLHATKGRWITPAIKRKTGMTAEYNYIKVLEFLLANGASLHDVDGLGRTPLIIAEENNMVEVKRRFKKHQSYSGGFFKEESSEHEMETLALDYSI